MFISQTVRWAIQGHHGPLIDLNFHRNLSNYSQELIPVCCALVWSFCIIGFDLKCLIFLFATAFPVLTGVKFCLLLRKYKDLYPPFYLFQIVILEHRSIICAGYSAILHIHTCGEEVTIKNLICLIDKKTGKKTPTRFIMQDQIGVARFQVNAGMICLETFQDFPQMGRFTLRDEGEIFEDFVSCGKRAKKIALGSNLYWPWGSQLLHGLMIGKTLEMSL